MSYKTTAYEARDHVAYLTLARPENGNCLNEALLNEIADACERAADDKEIRAVMLRANGEAFCLGWDASQRDERLRLARLADGFKCIAKLPKPVIAVIQGDALSAGLELALACDIRIAAESARFGLPEVGEGSIPVAGGTQRLPRLVGRANALQMILTAEPVDAAKALRYGLVNAAAPAETCLAVAEAIAAGIAVQGPIAVEYAKEAIARGTDLTLEQALRLETELTIILQTTDDRAEGVRAFLEKRLPHFNGR